MRRPTTIESLYIDFDSFFAAVMQQEDPALRDRPVGIIPSAVDNPDSSAVIACSKEAKARGLRGVSRVREAREICPDLVLVPQRPDLFRRYHYTLLNEIGCEIPIETVKSIDELTCRLDAGEIADPLALTARLKARIAKNVGRYVTFTLGFAANRHLAKIACESAKPDGVAVWSPNTMPGPLLDCELRDIPGIGGRMAARLEAQGIADVAGLLATAPKQLRRIWGNVGGERMWYALHGYALTAPGTRRGAFGHGRVLPFKARDPDTAHRYARLLLTKAARRMRAEGYCAGGLFLSLRLTDAQRYGADRFLPQVEDDHSCLRALGALWEEVAAGLPPRAKIQQVAVTLHGLTRKDRRQGDLFADRSTKRRRWEVLSATIDTLNARHGRRVVTIGTPDPPAAFAGGKISFTRIPAAEDFF